MKYLIVQDWKTTAGNHAGMVHMCKLLKDKYPSEYEIIIKDPLQKRTPSSNPLIRKAIYLYDKFTFSNRYFNEYIELCQPMFQKLTAEDEVYFLEYCLPLAPQYKIAKYIRKRFPNVKQYALSHLTPTFYKAEYYAKIIRQWSKSIDLMMTLGSSLSLFMEKVGVDKNKISTGFHYVDSDYYHRSTPLTMPNDRLKVIMMGGMQRDYSMLAELCKKTQFVDWIICRGRKPVDAMFSGLSNVELKGFLEEDDLKHQMEIADISLNIMDDTVGSNVITTSMAMGLAMVCSDVGSIRDYCNDTNALFCNNKIDDFVKALLKMNANKQMVYNMKTNSIDLSKKLEINQINKWFSSL